MVQATATLSARRTSSSSMGRLTAWTGQVMDYHDDDYLMIISLKSSPNHHSNPHHYFQAALRILGQATMAPVVWNLTSGRCVSLILE